MIPIQIILDFLNLQKSKEVKTEGGEVEVLEADPLIEKPLPKKKHWWKYLMKHNKARKKLKSIHDQFFNTVMSKENINGVYIVHSDGRIERVKDSIEDKPDPDDPYGLKYMTPLNVKEI